MTGETTTPDLERLAADLTSDGVCDWHQMRELGLDRVGVPEDLGGSGGTVGDLLTVAAVFAQQGGLTPLVDAAVSAHMMATSGLGDGFGTLVHGEIDEAHESSTTVSAMLTGVTDVGADHLVVFAEKTARVVDLTRTGVTMSPTGRSIAGEPLVDVRLEAVPCRTVPTAETAIGRRLWDHLELVEMVAHARGAHDLTRRWVKEREQFGRPLIFIPAVAARVAEMTVHLELARAALARCGGLHDAPTERGPDHQLASARLVVIDAVTLVARTAHQLHGAMGVTREYPLHPHTTAIWSRRDRANWRSRARRVLAERICMGEAALWDELTA